MKVLLVNPGREMMLIAGQPEVLVKGEFYYPPLNLLSLGTYLSLKTSHAVRVVDAELPEVGFSGALRAIREFKPDLIGLTVMSTRFAGALNIAQAAVAESPGIKVVFGGPHAELYPREIMEHPEIFAVIRGDGEIPLAWLADYLEIRGHNTNSAAELGIVSPNFEGIVSPNFKDAPGGIMFRRGDAITETGAPSRIKNLDDLPIPDRTLLPYKAYKAPTSSVPFLSAIIGSRGCPFRCNFCASPEEKHRKHSPERIAEDALICQKLGIRELHFFDEIFNVSIERMNAVAEALLKKNLSIKFSVRARVDAVDLESFKLLKRAGCFRIHFGIESTSPRVLELMNKKITAEQAAEAVRLAMKAGLQVHGYFLISYPGQTRKEVMEDLEFAKKLNMDYAHFSLTTLFPGTYIYDQAIKQRIIGTDVWKEYTLNPREDFVPPVWEGEMSWEESWELLERMFKLYYFRYRYIARSLLKVQSPREVVRKAALGLDLVRKRFLPARNLGKH